MNNRGHGKSKVICWMAWIVTFLILNGCAQHTRIKNTAHGSDKPKGLYSPKKVDGSRYGDIFLALSFSGGGTRAAAFSYGVLSELRDTQIIVNGKSKRLLDEVDHISSVSGGSFTAAYYGLFGDRIFQDYEAVFLRRNVQKTLINSILNPINWFRMMSSGFDRTTVAVDYYDKNIFKGKTFADMSLGTLPFIQINATDLGTGQSFGFTQESFDGICSDLSEFKVARAVAASSAVPVLFSPVTLENYPGCRMEMLDQMNSIEKEVGTDIRLKTLAKDMSSFADKKRRRYIHLVDGGIADNLGVRSMIYRLLLLAEARRRSVSYDSSKVELPKHVVVIVINAQTSKIQPFEQSPKAPSAAQVMGAVSAAQISRYNMETITQARKMIMNTARKISNNGTSVQAHFIELGFNEIQDMKLRYIFNNMATSFSLEDEQVDLLYESGRQLLKKSEEFKSFIKAWKGR